MGSSSNGKALVLQTRNESSILSGSNDFNHLAQLARLVNAHPRYG